MKPTQILIFLVCGAAVYGVLSVGRFAFKDQADAAFWDHLSGAGEKVAEMRAHEAEELHGGTLPIDQAIKAYAVKGRRGHAVIAPKGGEKLAPVTGWVNGPHFEQRAADAKSFTDKQQAAAAAAAAAAPADEETPAEAAE